MYQQEPGMQHIGKAWNHGQRVSASFIGTIVRATDTLKDIVMYQQEPGMQHIGKA